MELERCASTQIGGGAEIRAELMPRATCVVEWDGKPEKNVPRNGVGPPWQAASVPPGHGTTQTSIVRRGAGRGGVMPNAAWWTGCDRVRRCMG